MDDTENSHIIRPKPMPVNDDVRRNDADSDIHPEARSRCTASRKFGKSVVKTFE